MSAISKGSEYLLFGQQPVWGPKKEIFWPKINCIQIKLPNVLNSSADSSSKNGHDFSNKRGSKIEVIKKSFNKKCAL